MARSRKRDERVAGIDLSLQSTGVVVLPAPFVVPKSGNCRWGQVRSLNVGEALKETASEEERARRITKIASAVLELLIATEVTHAVIGGYTFQRGGRAFERAELAGVVKRDLYAYKIGIMIVQDTAARKLLIGKNPKVNPKSAAQMFIETAGGMFKSEDEYDAFTMANWGLAELGYVALMANR